MIWIIWAGASNPFKIADLDLKRYNIEIADRRQHPAGDGGVQAVPGMEGATYYYFGDSEEPGQRVAGRQPLQAVQGAARFLHRRRR